MIIINRKKYTHDFLLNELKRFTEVNGRPPIIKDFGRKNGYPSPFVYNVYFKSWSDAIKLAKLDKIAKKNKKSFLLNELKRFYNINKRTPSQSDFRQKNEYPSVTQYYKNFSSWNTAILLAGLDVNQIKTTLTGDEMCELCKSNHTTDNWRIINGKRLCNKCATGKRYYMKGILQPNCDTAIGVITEYVVYNVLTDSINCNDLNNFHATYDLISNTYGNINVKSAKLCSDKGVFYWRFGKRINQKIPNYYICLGFNENRTDILKVWIIPGTSNLVTKHGIKITNSIIGLKRALQYEVDAAPYNKVYQNLDIYSLPEFCNLNKSDEVTA